MNADNTKEHHALKEGLAGLSRAAASLGANTMAVLVLQADSVEIAYRGTADGEILPLTAPILCGPDVRAALDRGSGSVCAECSLARFLTAAVAPLANSFLLFPWRAGHVGIATVFGFEGSQPPCPSLPAYLTESLSLASLAAWSLHEVSRLRGELRRANDNYAVRKLVERAKGFLQTERGMSERQAYEYLRRTSRQRRIAMSKLAEDLLRSSHGRPP